jgi:signal transduction histidine kinase
VTEPAGTCTVDELRHLFIFEGLTDHQLTRLCADAEMLSLPPGVLCREGDPAAVFYVLLEGEIALSKRSGDRDIDMWRAAQPGSYCGAWSAFLLDDTHRYDNTATLTVPSRMLALPATAFGRFLRTEFPMASHLLIAHSTGRTHQSNILNTHERLVQLGQMTAGLTHELNNPAAAAARAADELRAQVVHLRHQRNEVPELVELQDRIAELAGKPNTLTSVEKSDLEDALGRWLDHHHVSDAWEHAGTFAEAGVDVDWMERVAAAPCAATRDGLNATVRWLRTTVETELLLTELTDATRRISGLVDYAKQYSQVDRAPFDLSNVHEQLESTLTMLAHRLGPDVTVVRDYDTGLPLLPCYPAELNQVWTNLIDNALDADPAGTLTLRTRREGDAVQVDVCDAGRGIPDALLTRIFDPYFTTKRFGEGTGLGLDTATRIVNRHRGNLWAESKPGDTCFTVLLPLTVAPDAPLPDFSPRPVPGLENNLPDTNAHPRGATEEGP